MSKVLVSVVLYFCLLSITYCENNYADHVIVVLERTLHYMKQNAMLMNLDAVFGLVLAEANLQQIIRQGVPQTYKNRIYIIEYIANQTLAQTKRYLKKTHKNVLFSHTVLLPEAWRKPINFTASSLKTTQFERKPLKNINTLNKYLDYVASSTLSELESDNCLIQLLKQQPYCCVEHKCRISANCQQLMVRDSKNIEPAYGATHSLLYMQIARSQQCAFNKLVLEEKINEYCSYIYWEMSKNEKFGFLEDLDDLLLEQVTLCGYEGFTEFLKNNIIEHVLSLQTDSGCFKLLTKVKKRETNLLENGCADHTTGLGVAALSVFLRYQLAKR